MAQEISLALTAVNRETDGQLASKDGAERVTTPSQRRRGLLSPSEATLIFTS